MALLYKKSKKMQNANLCFLRHSCKSNKHLAFYLDDVTMHLYYHLCITTMQYFGTVRFLFSSLVHVIAQMVNNSLRHPISAWIVLDKKLLTNTSVFSCIRHCVHAATKRLEVIHFQWELMTVIIGDATQLSKG